MCDIFIHPVGTTEIPKERTAILEIVPNCEQSKREIKRALVCFPNNNTPNEWLDLFLSQGWLTLWRLNEQIE